MMEDSSPPDFGVRVSMDNLAKILTQLDDGIMVTDANGVIVFYNRAMARIDNMDPAAVMGRNVVDVYASDLENSPTMRCILRQKPVRRFSRFYLTQHGRAVSALQDVFPLFDGDEFTGVINFIREYSSIAREMDTTSQSQKAHATPGPDHPLSNPQVSPNRGTFQCIIGNTPELLQTIRTAQMAAASPSPVMIFGESGTGKELFAQAIHNSSPWSDRPFVAVNCSAIPETLLEGILFGTARGAFTDAKDKPGLFEDANGGTLFLDELNSMPIGLQAKLLRAIQENTIRRVGSSREIDIRVKLLSSVNMEPEQAMAENALRRDLYYRLAVVYLSIPPLRNRLSDVPALVDNFIHTCNARLGRRVQAVDQEVIQIFLSYNWPGNVRELAHVIEGAMNMVDQREVIQVTDLPANFLKAMAAPTSNTAEVPREMALPGPPQPGEGMNLFDLQNQYEKSIICNLLEKYRGNANRAAIELGISRQLIYHKIKKHGIVRENFKPRP